MCTLVCSFLHLLAYEVYPFYLYPCSPTTLKLKPTFLKKYRTKARVIYIIIPPLADAGTVLCPPPLVRPYPHSPTLS